MAQVDARLNIVQFCIDVFICNARFEAIGSCFSIFSFVFMKKFSKKSKMDSEEFDTNLFIDEIEKRPPIWDMKSSEYSNKISKRKAWEEIVLIFSDPSDTEERKKFHGKYY